MSLLTVLRAARRRVELPPPAGAASPKYPDYIFPAVVGGLGTPAAQERHKAGWLWLQAGDLKAAERNFEAALKLSSAFYPSEAGLGYVDLAKKDHDEAASAFRSRGCRESALRAGAGRPRRGAARLGERDMALKSFEAAVVADPGLAGAAHAASRSCASAACRRTWRRRGRRRRRAGWTRRAAPTTVRIAASPDSPFLYRELGDVARRQGDLDAALRQAAEGGGARSDRRPRPGADRRASTRRARIRRAR